MKRTMWPSTSYPRLNVGASSASAYRRRSAAERGKEYTRSSLGRRRMASHSACALSNPSPAPPSASSCGSRSGQPGSRPPVSSAEHCAASVRWPYSSRSSPSTPSSAGKGVRRDRTAAASHAILAFMVFSSLVASVIEFSPTVPSAVDAAYVPSTTHAVSFAHSDHDRRSVDPRGRPIRAAASRKSAKTRFQYPRGAIASGACALRGPIRGAVPSSPAPRASRVSYARRRNDVSAQPHARSPP